MSGAVFRDLDQAPHAERSRVGVRHMVRRRAVSLATAAALLFTAATAGPASANHGWVQATITIVHAGIDTTYYVGTSPCSGASCQVFITVASKRDAGRFKRWCGPFALNRIDAGDSYATGSCLGPSTWSIRVDMTLMLFDGSSYVATTHGEHVWASVLLSP